MLCFTDEKNKINDMRFVVKLHNEVDYTRSSMVKRVFPPHKIKCKKKKSLTFPKVKVVPYESEKNRRQSRSI